MKDKTRVTVDLSNGDYMRLCNLQAKFDIKKADVLRNGLRIIEYLTNAMEEDWSVVLKKGLKEKTVVILPAKVK